MLGDVTAIIVNYRTPDLVMACVDALAGERRACAALDVVIVDGGSGDGSVTRLIDFTRDARNADWVSVLSLEINGGFGWANNQAMRQVMTRSSPPTFLYLINPDATVEPGALPVLIATLMAHPEAGAAGSQLISANNQRLTSAFRFPNVSREFIRGANTPLLGRLLGIASSEIDSDVPIECDWISGASVLFRAEALKQVGLFDDGFFLYFEEVELMHRLAKAGWQVMFAPQSRVRHIGGAATGVRDGASQQAVLPPYWFASRRRFFTRAYGSATAALAGFAWLAGFAFWNLRALLGLGRASGHAPGEMAGLLRHGLFASASDRRSSVSPWKGASESAPGWMKQ